MIAYLTGQVKHIEEKRVILLTNGVGYDVMVSSQAHKHCLEHPDQAELTIYSHIREDQFTLFGFSSSLEKELFGILISVSGIGPKTAMELLSIPADHLVRAILDKNAALIQQCPGIGKKTAERLVIEVSDKVAKLPLGNVDASAGVAQAFTHHVAIEQNYHDIIEALLQLGYDRKQILAVLGRYTEDHATEVQQEEDILKYCLVNL